MPVSSKICAVFALLSLCCLQVAAADVLVLKNGKVYEGEVISETPTEVVFHGKIAGVWSKVTFEKSRIDSIKREPGDQGPSSEPAAPTPTAPADEPTAEEAKSNDPPKSVEEDSRFAAVVEVVVSGTGKTPRDAFDDAIRAALVQVAGTFVRSDTKIENDQVVQDRIIAHSQGFIQSAERKGNPRLENGSYVQEAIVVVRLSKVAEVLEGGAAVQVAVDGDSLYARVRAMRESKATAAELLRAVFEGFPANVLQCAVAEGPTQIDVSRVRGVELADGEVLVIVKVDVWVDPDKWRVWCKGAREALNAIAAVKANINWNPRKAGATRITSGLASASSFTRCLPSLMSEETARADHLALSYGTYASVVDEILKLDVEKRDSSSKGSLKDGLVTKRDLRFIALLPLPTGRLDVYGVPLEALQACGIPWGVPLLDVEIQDESRAGLGAPVRFSSPDCGIELLGEGPAMWCELRYPYHREGVSMSASPVPYDMLRNKGFFLMPFVMGEDASPHRLVASTRVSFPCAFVMSESDLLSAKHVSAQLGVAGPRHRWIFSLTDR